MNIKEAIAQTQRKWMYWAGIAEDCDSCGFCKYAEGNCLQCPVRKVLKVTCGELPSYQTWERATGETPELGRAVLEDVNKIARAYHCKVVSLPEAPQ